jgi:hypothetical protein
LLKISIYSDKIANMAHRPISVFVALCLLVLQMLGPFLHAHAGGQAGQDGLHLHILSGLSNDGGASLRNGIDTQHWVLAMPQAHRMEADIAPQHLSEPQPVPLSYLSLAVVILWASRIYPRIQPQAPPGIHPSYTRPFSLAPPLA